MEVDNELVAAGFPFIAAVETEPDEGVNTEAVLPSCFDNVVAV